MKGWTPMVRQGRLESVKGGGMLTGLHLRPIVREENANEVSMNAAENKIISITPSAEREILRLLGEETKADVGLRLGVKGGGCSGLSYIIEFSEKRENDTIQSENGYHVYIDKKSSLYLRNTTFDFSAGIADRGFRFVNPNASNTCGCGESFSI
jgi:iron-sulfur cluster assembly protein